MKTYFLILLTIIMVSISVQSQNKKQTVNKFEKEISIKVSAQYLIYLPKDYDETKNNYPLVLFLHGAGERGEDIEKVKVHGLPRLVNEGRQFPFIIVSPQCPDDKIWDANTLIALLDNVEANYRVDKNKIYITGLSMGGYGTWLLAIAQPNRFAAIAPVCGWSNPVEICKLSKMPIWVFHGAKDVVVPIISEELLVERLKSCGSDIKFTVYPEANHDAWTETYNNDELYKWMLEQSLEKK